MNTIILGQAFGVIATVITFLSYQVNSKGKLLIIQSIATLCTCIGFLLLGATTGFALNVVCLVRNGVFFFVSTESRFHIPLAISLSVIMIIVGALSWQGWISLLIIVALGANTLFMSFGIPQLLRKSVIVTSGMILIYNVFVFSIGGIANEGVSIASSVIGIVRYRRRGEKVQTV